MRAMHANLEFRVLRRAIALLGIALFGWAANWTAIAQVAEGAGSIEYRVKAAFLYRFAGYVDWPAATFANPNAPLTIAIISAEGLAAELEKAVLGRTVGDRVVAVKRIKSGDSLAGVHLLFIGKAEAARLPQMVQVAQANSTLTVTESDGALRQGSVINFIIVEQRVRFEISLDSAEKSGLKLNSRLLAVAQQVLSGAP